MAIPSLAGPIYNDGVGLGWLTSDGFLGYHDDLMWPMKAVYLVLPFILSSQLNIVRVVDPKIQNDDGSIKYRYGFDIIKMAFHMCVPTGILWYWLICNLY